MVILCTVADKHEMKKESNLKMKRKKPLRCPNTFFSLTFTLEESQIKKIKYWPVKFLKIDEFYPFEVI